MAEIRSNWRQIVTPSPGSQVLGSVFIGEKYRGHQTVVLGDYEEPISGRSVVATQESGALNQRILVRMPVFIAKSLAPIATVVTVQIGG